VLVVPGGWGTRALMRDEAVLAWVRAIHRTTHWTTSVCTGSLVLAAAGLLDGLDAATHWGAVETLEKQGARYTAERVVQRGKIITAAGVSSGIDMALTLAALAAGEQVAKAIQLAIEYDPQPPFDARLAGEGRAGDHRSPRDAARAVRRLSPRRPDATTRPAQPTLCRGRAPAARASPATADPGRAGRARTGCRCGWAVAEWAGGNRFPP